MPTSRNDPLTTGSALNPNLVSRSTAVEMGSSARTETTRTVIRSRTRSATGAP